MSLRTWHHRVPTNQIALPPSAQLSLGQCCHRQKKSCVYAHRAASVVSDTLQPCRLWPARLLCQGGESPSKNTGAYWLILIATPSESESEVSQSCPTLCDPMDSNLHQALPSMGFSRQQYWSGLPFPSPWNLPNPGIKPRSPAL